MIGRLIIYVWRFIVFCLALGLAYSTAFIIFPYLDKKLPVFPVLLIIYLGLAYVGIPALIRIWRLVIKPDHIPVYVTTPDGWPADPVNIAIIATSEKHLTSAMRLAGWYTADKGTWKNLLREGWAILLDKPYLTAPFSKLYLFGRSFDIGFQKPKGASMSPRSRHHVRFWQLIDPPGIDHDHHYTYWFKYIRHLLHSDRKLWIGAAMDDTGPLAIRWRNFQLTHANNEDTNRERDYIIGSLKNAGLIKSMHEIGSGETIRFRGQNFGNDFISDGKIQVVVLKRNIEIAAIKQTVKTAGSKRRRIQSNSAD